MSDEWRRAADRSSHSTDSQRDERCASDDHSSLIAVIDVGGVRGGAEGRARSPESAVIEQIGSACTTTGFFVVVGHGIAAEMAAVFDAAHRFFSLPLADKTRSAMVDNQGYAGVGSVRSDRKEMLDIGLHGFARWPDVAGFRQAVEHYQRAALRVAEDLLRALAVTLDVDPAFFADRMHDPQCFLRMLRYPPTGEPATTEDAMTGQHTDYGAITLLATDGVPGLEVRLRDGTWTAVDAPAGSLVVNLETCSPAGPTTATSRRRTGSSAPAAVRTPRATRSRSSSTPTRRRTWRASPAASPQNIRAATNR